MSEESINLSIEDLSNVLRAISVASERGAFKANELSFVGIVYDRISRFVDAATKASTATAATANDGANTDGSE